MATYEKIYSLIQAHDTITLFAHGIPDGDCYGCQIGLRELIKNTFPNKKVYAIGTGVPHCFERLSPMDIVDEETIASSLAILLDVSCLKRVEDPRVFQAKAFAKFDHHCFNPDEIFEFDAVTDEGVISCCEMIADFAFAMNMKFSKLAAEALYAGMATDSGRFRFFGTTPHTFEVIAKLAQYGIEFASLLEVVFQEEENVRAYKAFLRKSAKTFGQVAYMVAWKKDYDRYVVPLEKAGNYANAISGVGKKPIFVLFTDNGDGTFRTEIRSNKQYPIHPVAVMFGGGGHMHAAGATISTSDEKYMEVVKALNEVRV